MLVLYVVRSLCENMSLKTSWLYQTIQLTESAHFCVHARTHASSYAHSVLIVYINIGSAL